MRRRLALALLGLLTALLPLSAVSGAGPPSVQIAAVQETAGRITLTVDIATADGKPVTNLSASNFTASLDGQPLSVAAAQSTALGRSPVAIVLVVDVSGSMQGDPIVQARRAIQQFLLSLNPNDQVAVYAFDSNVRLVQDFSSDRAAVGRAVNSLTPNGDTALYDAVLEGIGKAASAPTPRKYVVLETDGESTLGLDKRQASLDAAASSGVGIVAIGLGKEVDAGYLSSLAAASGGRYLQAPAPAALRQAYADLADYLRGEYTVTLNVPPDVDRTVSANLTLVLNPTSDNVSVQRVLPPLAGALPPSFAITVDGLAVGQKLGSPAQVSVSAADGRPITSVDYTVDDRPIDAASSSSGLALDPASLAPGNHILNVVAHDDRGRTGSKQVPFVALGPPVKSSAPSVGVFVLVLMALLLAGSSAFLLIKRIRSHVPAADVAPRIKPWSTRLAEPAQLVAEAPAEPQPVEPEDDRPRGRVVVMDEAAVRAGDLAAVRDFPIGSLPLSLGANPACDIVLQDDEGLIGAEEARLWVQRGRLVYHKLTTLSAMATEGLTSGWLFLDSGDEIRLGPYVVSYQAVEEEPSPAPAPVQEPHRTRLVELWPTTPDDAPYGAPQ